MTPPGLTISENDAKAPGFTLIELLVVIAIISILATIAVPNFLEAQVRAKVSRVKADIRTVGLAMEAYATDHNRYPYVNPGDDHSYLPDVPVLTTPVAYMTTLPKDPFARQSGDFRKKSYRYYPIDYWKFFYPDLRTRNWHWIVMSNGPDQDIDIDRTNAQDAIDGILWMLYDPTNGSISAGDIWITNEGVMGGASY